MQLRNAETEIGKLRAALDQFERLSTDYKTQLEHYRSECSDLQNRLRQQDDVMTAKLKESMHEVNDVSGASILYFWNLIWFKLF